MMIDYGVALVRPATTADAEALAPNLRAEDIREIAALTDKPPLEVLKLGVTHATECFAVVLKSGEVVALFGVTPTPEPKLGGIWLLAADNIKQIRYTFLRHSRHWLTRLFDSYSFLGNCVDARNELHVSWLRWLDFRFLRRAPLGMHGEEFFEFVKMKE